MDGKFSKAATSILTSMKTRTDVISGDLARYPIQKSRSQSNRCLNVGDPRWPSSLAVALDLPQREKRNGEKNKREREREKERKRENWLVARKYQRLIQPDCIRSCDDFTSALKTAWQTHFPFREFFSCNHDRDEQTFVNVRASFPSSLLTWQLIFVHQEKKSSRNEVPGESWRIYRFAYGVKIARVHTRDLKQVCRKLEYASCVFNENMIFLNRIFFTFFLSFFFFRHRNMFWNI